MFFPEIALKLWVPMETSGKTACWLKVKFCYDCFLDNKCMLLKAWPQQTPAAAHGKSHIFLRLRGWERPFTPWRWATVILEGRVRRWPEPQLSPSGTGPGASHACSRQDAGERRPRSVSNTNYLSPWSSLPPAEVICNVLSRPKGERVGPGVEAWKIAKETCLEKGQCNLKKETESKGWIQRAGI